MKINKVTWAIPGLLMAVVVSGCGGDSDDGPTSFATGRDRDEELGNISAADAEQLCEEGLTYLSNRTKQSLPDSTLCTIRGMEGLANELTQLPTDAELQQICATERDECLADPPAGLRAAFEPDESACEGAVPSDCTAKVGDYEDCVNGTANEIARLSTKIPTCEELTLSLLIELNTNQSEFTFEQPEACEAINECTADDMNPPVGGTGGADSGSGGSGGADSGSGGSGGAPDVGSAGGAGGAGGAP